MEATLAEALGTLAEGLPSGPDDDALELSRTALPAPPARLRTCALAIQRGEHEYHDAARSGAAVVRVEMLMLFAASSTLRQLGLLLLATVFHPQRVTVRLEHQASHARALVVEPVLPAVADPGGLRLEPTSYTYWPEEQDRHPLAGEASAALDLPFVTLGPEERDREELHLERRRVVREESSVHGRVRLAKVLLDAGRPGSARDELNLESERGFGGVARGSCEVRIWLPGSVGWPPAP